MLLVCLLSLFSTVGTRKVSELVERAKAFALEAHRGQTRLNKDKTPLAIHIEEVVSLVEQSGGSEEEIAAAWLHDVVEDTSQSLEDIRDNFGEEVASIVHGLTDPPEFNFLHTLERKRAQARRVSDESDSVKRVKIADQISNVRSVAVDPPVKWDSKKRLDYANGARLVAKECRGASVFLYKKFETVFLKAHRKHGGYSGVI